MADVLNSEPSVPNDPAQAPAEPPADLTDLREQLARYRAAFELSAPGQAMLSLDGQFIAANASLCQLLGRTCDELRQLHFWDITHPDDRRTDVQHMARMKAGTQAHFQREKRYLRADGSTVWAQVTSHLAHDAAGRPLHFVTIIEDITERKAAELALREREALLSSMGKFVPGLIHKIGFDAHGRARFLYLSDRALEMFELPHELMERDYFAHHRRVHPEDMAYVQRLAKAPAPGAKLRPVDFEYRVILPSKGLRVYGGHAIPVTEEDGSIVWYGHTADLTDKKALHTARMAAQTAQAANAAKNEFLSRISHELRTPLNAVIGFAQLLRMNTSGQLNAAQHQHAAHIENAGAHLLGIINDVLDLSRIEAGNLPLSSDTCQASLLLAEACLLVQPLAREHGVTVQPPQLRGDPLVHTDPMRLRQVLVNLLSNAIKYNRSPGQVMPRIWAEGDQVAIAIDDTGPGLSEQQQNQLFEPFNRLGAERSGIEGTGIGLVIVRKLLEAMRGRLQVRSQLGQGSSFIAWMPLAQHRAEPDAPTLPGTDAPASASAPAPAAPAIELKAIYAEDNEVNAELVREVLKLRPGCELRVAPSGEHALEMGLQDPPDLFLLDMNLGDMDGIELANKLQQEPALRNVPRVAFSADAMPDQIHRARASGFAGYLTKPLDIQALLACIDEHTARVRQAQREADARHG